ncbi:MAG: hypothetical protein LBO62_03775, partial [Endomicrobium sp.]|nr:hypothetical protein [Endomicrobium sp.]
DINAYLRDHYKDFADYNGYSIKMTKFFDHVQMRQGLGKTFGVELYYWEFDPINANSEDGTPNIGNTSKMYLHKYIYNNAGEYVTKERADVFGDWRLEVSDFFTSKGMKFTAVTVFVTALSLFVQSRINKLLENKEQKDKKNKKKAELAGAGVPLLFAENGFDTKDITSRRYVFPVLIAAAAAAGFAFLAVSLAGLAGITLSAPIVAAAAAGITAVVGLWGFLFSDRVRSKLNDDASQKAAALRAAIARQGEMPSPEIAIAAYSDFTDKNDYLTEIKNKTDAVLQPLNDDEISSVETREQRLKRLNAAERELSVLYIASQKSKSLSKKADKQEIERAILDIEKQLIRMRMDIKYNIGVSNNKEHELASALDQNDTNILSYLRNGLNLDVKGQSFFAEYRRYVKTVLKDTDADVKNFNIDDVAMFYYIFRIMRNARVHTPAVRNALLYAVKTLQGQDQRKAGKMLSDNAAAVIGYLTKGVSADQVKAREQAILEGILAKYNVSDIEALKSKPSNVSDRKAYNNDVKIAEALEKNIQSPQDLKNMASSAAGRPLLPVMMDALFRTSDWAKEYIQNIRDNVENDSVNFAGFSTRLTPYQPYISVNPKDDRKPGGFLKFIDIFNITKNFSNKMQLLVNIKSAVSYSIAATMIPLGVAIGITLSVPLIGAAIVAAGIAAAALFYNVIAPWINSKLQANSDVMYFGKPVSFKGNPAMDEQTIKQKWELAKRWVSVFIVNTASMTLLMSIGVAAIKWILANGGLAIILPTTLLSSGILPIVLAVVALSFVPHFTEWFKERKAKRAASYGLLTSLGAAGVIIGLFAGFFALTSAAPILGTLAIGSVFLPIFLMLPKLSTFSVWKIFEAWEARKEFKNQKISDTKKTWSDFRDSFGSSAAALADADAYFENNELYQRYKATMVPPSWLKNAKTEAAKEELTRKYFIKDWNKIIHDMHYTSSMISVEEYAKYQFELNDKGAITKAPDMSLAPRDLEAQERFFEMLKNWRADEKIQEDFDGLPPVAGRTPAFNEAVLQTLDVEDAPSEKLNSDEVSPNGDRLFTTIARNYIDQFMPMYHRLTANLDTDGNFLVDADGKTLDYYYDMNGKKQNYTADDLVAARALKSMIDENGEIITGKLLRAADGSFLPECRIKTEIEVWANKRLQPLSKTLLEYSVLLDSYFESARRTYPEWSEEEVKEAVKSKFMIIAGYQDFWNLYKKNPNDVRVQGVIKVLELFRERGIGYEEFVIIPVMRVADEYSGKDYKKLKDKQRNNATSNFEDEVIEEIERQAGGEEKVADDKKYAVPAVTQIILEQIDNEKFNDLLNKSGFTRKEIIRYEELKKKIDKLNDKEKTEYDILDAKNAKLKDFEYFRLLNLMNLLNAEKAKYARWAGNIANIQDSQLDENSTKAQEIRKVLSNWKNMSEAQRDAFVFKQEGGELTIFNFKQDKSYITDIKGVFVGAFGKVEHLSLLDIFIPAGWLILTADMNMGAYIEDMMRITKLFSLLKKDPRAFVVSFGEFISSRRFGTSIAAAAAHADRTFNYVTQLTMIMRFYYGHPSIVDGTRIATVADQALMVSEDMMGAMMQFVKQGALMQDQDMQELKKLLGEEAVKGKTDEQIREDLKEALVSLLNDYIPNNRDENGVILKDENGKTKGELIYEQIVKNPNSKELAKIIEAFGRAGAMSYYDSTMKVNKGREVAFANAMAMFEKFSSGAAQALTSYEQSMFNENHSFLQQLTHFFAGPGFYEKDRASVGFVKYAVYFIVFAGVSFFSAAPGLSFLLGIFGILMSQTGALTGLLKVQNTKGENFFTWAKDLLMHAPYHMANMYIHASGFTKGLSFAQYIATGRTARLKFNQLFGGKTFDDANSSLYQSFAESHIDTNIRTAIIALVGIYLIRSATLLLSGIYLAIPFAVLGAVLFFNQGGSVTNADYRAVSANYKQDMARWADLLSRKGVSLPNAKGETKTVNPIMAFVAGVFMYSYSAVYNAVAFLFSKKSNGAQKAVAGIVGAGILAVGIALAAPVLASLSVPTLIVGALAALGLGIAKIVADNKAATPASKASVLRKAAGLVTGVAVLGSLALWVFGAPVATLLIGVGALALFFGTRGGMNYPYSDTEKKLKEHGFPINDITKTVPAVDIDYYAEILKKVDLTGVDEQTKSMLMKIDLNKLASTVNGLIAAKADAQEDYKISFGSLHEKLNSDLEKISKSFTEGQAEYKTNIKKAYTVFAIIAVPVISAIAAFISAIPAVAAFLGFTIPVIAVVGIAALSFAAITWYLLRKPKNDTGADGAAKKTEGPAVKPPSDTKGADPKAPAAAEAKPPEAEQQKPADDSSKPADASSKDNFKIITEDFTFPVLSVPKIQAKYPSVEI